MPAADVSSASQPALTIGGVSIRYSLISLCTLTAQNSILACLIHHSRTSSTTKPFSAAAAVLLNEILKGSISFIVALGNADVSTSPASPGSSRHYNNGNGATLLQSSGNKRSASLGGGNHSHGGVSEGLWRRRASSVPKRNHLKWYTDLQQITQRSRIVLKAILGHDCWKLAVPAALYVLQNNLQYVAASNLDVATFQISYQMKILTTAFFSVTMLDRRLSLYKWGCLFALAMGVAIVQIQGSAEASALKSGRIHMDRFAGFMAVVLACLTSGFAGVYFEKVVKTTTADLWVRNVQLTLFSLPPAILAALYPDISIRGLIGHDHPSHIPVTQHVGPAWMFEGFGFWTWATVLTQCLGGLMTALVIKYSDNIAKGFATSLSIIITAIAGVFLFDFQITMPFVVGSAIVLASTWYYNQPAPDVMKSRASAAYDPLSKPGHAYVDMSESQLYPEEKAHRKPSLLEEHAKDPQYPFSDYPSPNVKPPEFINLSPFTAPLASSNPPHLTDGQISPRSPVPPSGDSPFR